jgi:REP element-mobilizing transposase RayT
MEPGSTNLRPAQIVNANKLRALAYFLTFRTYGTWLHGDERGSVDRQRNRFATPMLPENRSWRSHQEELLQQPPVVFSERQRHVCQQAMVETCRYRRWTLRAINVRTNHVHVVLSADVLPERVMNDLKAYATRALRRSKLVGDTQRVWSYHGSTRLLYTPDRVQQACIYTVEQQGSQLGAVLPER